MLRSLAQEEIREILDRVMQDITNRLVCIYPCTQDALLSDDICTVQTTFEGGYCASLTLCADTALFTRLAQQMLEEETISPQDVEDFAKEYFNVICGQIVAKLFQSTHVASRFHIPEFHIGRPCSQHTGGCCCILNYTSRCNGGAQLIHHPPLSAAKN